MILEFELENSKPIRFIADLLWCEPQPDGQFFSGGKLLELVNPVAEIKLPGTKIGESGQVKQKC